VYRCPNPGCRREIAGKTVEACPSCGFDLTPLARVAGLADHYFNRALELSQAGDEALAVESLVAAVTVDPHDHEAHLLLGHLYSRQGNRALARLHWEKALELNPHSEEARRRLEEAPEAPAPAGGRRRLPFWLAGAAAAVMAVVAFAAGWHLAGRGSQAPAPGVLPAPDPAAVACGLEEEFASEPQLAGAVLRVRPGERRLVLEGEVVTPGQLLLAYGMAARRAEGMAVEAGGVSVMLERVAGYRYSLKEGETLWDLARRVYGDPGRWRDIARASGISDPARLPVGAELILPVFEGAPLPPVGRAGKGG